MVLKSFLSSPEVSIFVLLFKTELLLLPVILLKVWILFLITSKGRCFLMLSSSDMNFHLSIGRFLLVVQTECSEDQAVKSKAELTLQLTGVISCWKTMLQVHRFWECASSWLMIVYLSTSSLIWRAIKWESFVHPSFLTHSVEREAWELCDDLYLVSWLFGDGSEPLFFCHCFSHVEALSDKFGWGVMLFVGARDYIFKDFFLQLSLFD